MGSTRTAVLLLVASSLALPRGADAQPEEGGIGLSGNGFWYRSEAGEQVLVDLGCPALSTARSFDRLYVAAGRCGALRFRVGPDGIEQGEQILIGEPVSRVIVRGAVVVASGPSGEQTVDRLDAPWSTLPTTTRATSQTAPPVRARVRDPSTLREDASPPVAAPPRHPGSWELGGELYGIVSMGRDSGVGFMPRLKLVYRAEAPVSARLDLMPVGVGVSDDFAFGVVLALASAGLDLQGFALGGGLGVVSVNGSTGPGASSQAAALAFGAHMRIGVADGAHFLVRGGLHIGQTEAAEFTFMEGQLQIPLVAEVAIILRGGMGMGTFRAHTDMGVRIWLTGLGESGSVGLTGRFGWGLLQDRTTRDELSGPAFGLGLEGRL